MRAGLSIQLLVALLTVALVRGPAHAMPAELLPAVVPAATGPRLVVVALGLDKRARTQIGLLEAAGEEAARRAGRFDLLPIADAYDPAEARARASREQDAVAKMKDGQKALDDLDNQKATELYTAANKALAETNLSRSWELYLQSLRRMAASHATGGENGPARADMERVIALDPGATFSPNFFPPDLLKAAEAAKKVAQAAKGELAVKTRPDGARVWVDGEYRGLAPVSVSGLAPGKHWVSAVLGGYGLTQVEAALGEQTVDLKTVELSPAYTRAEDQVSKDAEGSGRDAALVALGKKLGADEVLAFIGRKSAAGEQVELTGLRLDTRDGHNFGYGTTTLRMGDDRAAATFAESLLAKDEPRRGRDPVTHYRGGLSFTPKKLAAFSLFGFGALALGTGIVFGVSALNNANQFRATPQVQQVVSANLAGTGRAFSVVADISYLLALASVVTGGVLFFTDRGPVVADGATPAAPSPAATTPPAAPRRAAPARPGSPTPSAGPTRRSRRRTARTRSGASARTTGGRRTTRSARPPRTTGGRRTRRSARPPRTRRSARTTSGGPPRTRSSGRPTRRRPPRKRRRRRPKRRARRS